MDWQFENDRPIYTQLIEQIERAVVTEIYPAGSKLPGVRELAEEAGVNPNTMQRALAELEGKRLLFSQRTSGRFVTEDAEKIRALREELARHMAGNFIHSMRSLGCSDDEISRYMERAKEDV